eukprot:3342968-Pyramimonas_sp.AAC.1
MRSTGMPNSVRRDVQIGEAQIKSGLTKEGLVLGESHIEHVGSCAAHAVPEADRLRHPGSLQLTDHHCPVHNPCLGGRCMLGLTQKQRPGPRASLACPGRRRQHRGQEERHGFVRPQ